jgi:ADP-ribose pyrophosphatase YjhB (NUDIX family)
MFTIGVFTVIFDLKDRVLLCHRRDADVWNLPGGGMQLGELPTETAMRETKEETGLDVKVTRLVGVYSKPKNNDLVFVFHAEVIGGALNCTDEADQIEYFFVENLPENTIPKHVGRIDDALARKMEPIFRQQSSPSTGEFLQKNLNQ